MKATQQKSPPSRPSLANILASHCDVCFVSFEKLPPKKLEEGLDILLCSTCHINVHKTCYDFQPALTVVSDRISQFLCERCRSEDLKKAKCIVCYGGQGAMKTIGEKEVIHVYCGLVHNDIEVYSYYPSISFKKSMQYEESTHSCEICHNRNAHDQCAEESCRRKVHTFCVKSTYVALSKEVDEPHSWNHHMSKGNNNLFDLTDEVIPYELLSDEVQSQLKELGQLGVDLSSKELIKRKIHKEYLQELRSRRKTTKKLHRGGFSYVFCPQHEITSYCVCYGKSQGDMVQCQCCFEWYHQLCIKFNSSKQDATFICSLCYSFYDLKKKIIDEIHGGRSDNDISKAEMPLKLSVMDCMWLMRVIDSRIRGGGAAKMLKQLVKYPLKSSCMDLLIRHQNRSKLTGLADECLSEWVGSEYLLSALKPRAVLRVEADGKCALVEENIQFNKRVRRVLQGLEGMGLRGQGLSAILRELQFKDGALSDQYEQIIELSKVAQKYQEVQILKQKARAYDFIEIIRKINDNTPVSYHELQQSLQKAQATPNLPPYLTLTLTNKYNDVSNIINNIDTAIQQQPENTYLIDQLVEQLQTHHLQPPPQYFELKMERKFIQDLYLYYLKQSGKNLQETTIQQKISELLAQPALKPSQELTDIVNSYRPTSSLSVWKDVAQIAKKCQIIAVQFELKQLLKRKYCKQQKFLQLMQRATEVDLSSEDVKTVVRSWIQLKARFDQAINTSLEEVVQFDQLSDMLKNVADVLNRLQSFPVKIQEDLNSRQPYLLAQIRTRKQQVEQLKILYTEAQLHKNPLTITKLLPTLPKNNPLVKQYSNLRREQTNFTSKYTTILARINERLESFKNDSKKQRKDQIRENNEKPTMNEINDFIEILKHSSVDMSREIRELTAIIENCISISCKVTAYVETKGDCQKANLDQLNVRRKEIDELRKKVLNVAELNLKSELTQLYHLQICNRMRTALLSPNLELDKINTLLKFAEEENLTHVETYIALKDKYETKNQKSKEVNLVKNLEQMLASEAAKDTNSGSYPSLYLYRRNLVLPEINDIKIKNSYIEELIEKNKQLRQKIANLLQKTPSKAEFNEARAVYLEALKNPFNLNDINKLNLEISKTAELVRRWKELGKNYNSLNPIFADYDNSLFLVEEIEAVKREFKVNQEQLGKLNDYVEAFDECYCEQLEDILERIENNSLIRDTEVCQQAQVRYLQYWIKLLQLRKQKKVETPYQKLKRLMFDAYSVLQRQLKRGEDYSQIKTVVYELEDLMNAIRNHVKANPAPTNNYLADNFIDVQQLYLQYEDQTDMLESIPLLRPFSDLVKFRLKNLQRLQARRQQNSSKRSRQKFQQLKGESQKHITLKQDSSSSEEVPQVVSDNERRKIKEIFLKNIRKNTELRKYGDCEAEVKMIENQIFGQWHNDIIKYFEMSEQFQKLFIKLVACPNISNKIIKKKFEFKFIQLLVTNFHKIDELEVMLVTKAKVQDTEKAVSVIEDKPPPKQQQTVIDSIATGKLDDSLRQDLKKEMRLLKDAKNKKKKHHHKHRSRSRSRSPEAKFSSDSEKELPSYIQNQYNKEETAKTTDKKIDQPLQQTQSPLRYDPEQQELKNRQNIFPKGSLLKLRNCEVELISKRKGRVQFGVELLTDEEHKKILTDLVEPGFSKLPIRKEKGEAQIIQYINKSKKKYKYLIGWFEALHPEDNEYLRELSAEASERKKVFGWQNQHIKIHIMSIRQLVHIPRFVPPTRVTSPQAAQILATDRMVFVFQYPQKIYEIKDLYTSFTEIQLKTEEYPVSVPLPVVEAPAVELDPYYLKYTIPSILPPASKPTIEQPKIAVQYEGWGSESTSIVNTPQPISPYSIALPPVAPAQSLPQQQPPPVPPPNIPYKFNLIRMQLGFGSFSPILTDDDQEDDKSKEDLASNLLNSLDMRKMPASSLPPPQINREKPMPQQQYQNYYNNYSYPVQPRSMPPTDNRWASYPGINQPMGQPQDPQGQPYNPQGQMPGKYPMNIGQMPVPGQPGQIYKPPMMGQGQRANPNLGGQYYRGPEGYDPRYQGGYQQ